MGKYGRFKTIFVLYIRFNKKITNGGREMVNKTVINKTCIVFYGRKHIVMSAWDWALFRGNGNSREKLMRFKLFLNSIVCGVRLILHKG